MRESRMKFILPLILIFFLNCPSFPSFQKDAKLGFFGCKDKKRAEKIECIADMLDELELLVDTKNPPKSVEVSRKRVDPKYVAVLTRTCFSPHFCIDETNYLYQPTLTGTIQTYGVVGALSCAACAGTAVSLIGNSCR